MKTISEQAQTAKLIKERLKELGISASVKSSTYAGGTLVRITLPVIEGLSSEQTYLKISDMTFIFIKIPININNRHNHPLVNKIQIVITD